MRAQIGFCGNTYTHMLSLLNENMLCMRIFVRYRHTLFFSCTLQQFPLLTTFQPFFFLLCLASFLASSGEMHELHADGDPDGEAPWQLQGTGAVLLSGRTQVVHPLEALAQE